MPPFRSPMLQPRAGSFAGIFVMIAITATIAAAVGQFMATGLGAPGAGGSPRPAWSCVLRPR